MRDSTFCSVTRRNAYRSVGRLLNVHGGLHIAGQSGLIQLKTGLLAFLDPDLRLRPAVSTAWSMPSQRLCWSPA